MTTQRLLQHFDRIAEAPDAMPRLRRFILDLAVRGKLIEQDPGDEPAAELLKQIRAPRRNGHGGLVEWLRSRAGVPIRASEGARVRLNANRTLIRRSSHGREA